MKCLRIALLGIGMLCAGIAALAEDQGRRSAPLTLDTRVAGSGAQAESVAKRSAPLMLDTRVAGSGEQAERVAKRSVPLTLDTRVEPDEVGGPVETIDDWGSVYDTVYDTVTAQEIALEASACGEAAPRRGKLGGWLWLLVLALLLAYFLRWRKRVSARQRKKHEPLSVADSMDPTVKHMPELHSSLTKGPPPPDTQAYHDFLRYYQKDSSQKENTK